jgi:hypothetical protein
VTAQRRLAAHGRSPRSCTFRRTPSSRTISQPDIEGLFGELQASTSYEQFSSLVRQAQGSAGLMRFWRLDLDTALTLDPQAADRAGLHLVRLIAGNPVTMGEMTRHVADAGSYAPVTILIQQQPGGGTRVRRAPRTTARRG